MLIAIDGSTIYPILSSIQNYFGVSERLIVWTFNIEILFLMLGTPICAKLADVFGRRKMYVLSTFLFLLGTLIVTFSHDFSIFLLGRALQGIGATISFLAIIIIGDHFTENRGTILGFFGVIIGLVYALGPVISGFMVNYDWHNIFAINLPVAAIVLLLGFYLLPTETKPDKTISFDWKGMALLGIAIASFTILINEFCGFPVSPIMKFLSIICLLSLAVFWYVEKRVQDKILPLDLLKKRDVLITCIITIFGYIAGAGTYFLSTFSVNAFDVDYSQAAYLLVPFTISSLLATIVVGKLLDKTGPKPIMIAGGFISMIGMLMLSTAGSIGTYVISIILIGIGNAAIAGNALYYLMLRETTSSKRASGQGMLNLMLNGGSLIGGALLGAALDTGGEDMTTFRTVYLGLAIIYLMLALLVLGLEKDKFIREKMD